MSTLPSAAASATAEPETSEKKRRRHREPAADEADEARGKIHEPPGDARVVHQRTREDEKRHRDHREAVGPVE